MLKATYLRFRKTIVHRIAVVKSEVNKTCANGACRVKVKNSANAAKIMNVAETCTRDRRDLIREGNMRIKNKSSATAELARDADDVNFSVYDLRKT